MNKVHTVPQPLRILIIGSLPPPLGGTAVSLKHLVDHLVADSNLDVQVTNTSGIQGNMLTGLFRFVRTMFKLLLSAVRVDIMTLHCASTALPFFGLFVLGVARLLRRPLIVRKFAGFDYMDLGALKGRLAHFVVRHADLYLAQTKWLVQLAKERGVSRVKWYPTSRPMPVGREPLSRSEKPRCRRFVFMGHVNNVKGVREILGIDGQLSDSVSVDVFGPFTGTVSEKDFDACKRVRYMGMVNPDQVISTLAQYDALLLPTYHPGEGYPGVIIEAYAAGLPVICTRWRALPEIVDDISGILIPTRDPDALLSAMNQLVGDDELYARLREGAWKRRQEFSSEVWAEPFVEYCREVAASYRQRKG